MAAKPKAARKAAAPAPAPKPVALASSSDIATMDRLIHERSRLAIVSALAANAMLTFNDLKSVLGISDGNLSTHCRKLEDAGYIHCLKGYDGRMPRTEYRLAPEGRQALQDYLGHMEALIASMKKP